MGYLWRVAVSLLVGLGTVVAWPHGVRAEESEEVEVIEEEASAANGSEFDGEDGRRIAVVALGEGPQSGSAIETLQELLDERGFEVLDEQTLRERIDQAKVPDTAPEVANEFVDLTEQIANGIEKFFYKGNEDALDALTPALNLGMAHPDVLARRPDFSSQVYEAGVVMMRAYRNLGKDEKARHLARALTAMFPGVDRTSESTPPDVVELLSEARERIEKEDARLEVDKIDGDDCKALVNGTSVDDEPLAVRPERSYYVTLECGSGTAPLWKVEVDKGESLEVPAAREDPLDQKMNSGGYSDRQRVESYLRAVLFWGRVPRVVGVADAADDDDPAAFVLVHTASGRDAGWSDRADETEASRMLARVMPDYENGADGAAMTGGGGGRQDWLSWSLVGTGLASAGLGSAGLFASNRRATAIACSPDTSASPPEGRCDGVEALSFANDEEIDEGQREVTTVRIFSAVGLVGGLGLAGWGTYRLLNGDSRPGEQTAMRLEIDLSPGHAGLTTTVRF